VGDLARGYLQPAPYTSIALEIDAVASAVPDSVTRSYLVQLVRQETKKPVTETGSHLLTGKSGTCWSQADIVALSTNEARTHTGGAVASLRLFFLDGSHCSGSAILGEAYRSGSIAIFTTQVNALATPTVSADTFMKAVTTHEFGHILALVNIGYKSPRNHEDAQHKGHSSNKNSVMYWAIDRSDLIQQFVSGPPIVFDADDEADLQDLRDGKL
jgi:hypothetical protein